MAPEDEMLEVPDFLRRQATETDAQREQRISDMQERAGEQPQPHWPEQVLVEKTNNLRFQKRTVVDSEGRGVMTLRILQQKVTVRHQKDGGESMFDEWRDVEEE